MLTGQLPTATAPANWTRSPAEILGNCERKGIKLLTESAIPRFAKNAGSTVGKMSIEPSAPPPLRAKTTVSAKPIVRSIIIIHSFEGTHAEGPLLREMAMASSGYNDICGQYATSSKHGTAKGSLLRKVRRSSS